MSTCTMLVIFLLGALVGMLFVAVRLMGSRAKLHEDLAVCRERLSWMRQKEKFRSKKQ
jgi:hypothetical protein